MDSKLFFFNDDDQLEIDFEMLSVVTSSEFVSLVQNYIHLGYSVLDIVEDHFLSDVFDVTVYFRDVSSFVLVYFTRNELTGHITISENHISHFDLVHLLHLRGLSFNYSDL